MTWQDIEPCSRPLPEYAVWVGGVDDWYPTKEKAEEAAAEWRAKGYTDVVIEKGLRQ